MAKKRWTAAQRKKFKETMAGRKKSNGPAAVVTKPGEAGYTTVFSQMALLVPYINEGDENLTEAEFLTKVVSRILDHRMT